MSASTPATPPSSGTGNGAPSGPPAAGNTSADFQRYQAGSGGFAGPAPGMVMGWAMPPSFAPLPQWGGPFPGGPEAGHPGMAHPHPGPAAPGNLSQGFGNTLKLGVDVVNALLSSTIAALSGAASLSQAYAPSPYGGAWHGYHGGGCGCGSCGGHDCCDVMGCSGCQPRVCDCC